MAQLIATEPLSDSAATATRKPRRTLSRTHADYWKSRLFRRSYSQDGESREVNDLYVRIQYGGRREFLPLNTTIQQKASQRAADIYISIRANGWDAALAEHYKDSETTPKLDVTIGDYLTAVANIRKLRARTFDNYRRCLHTIAAETFGIRPKKNESKYDYRTGGHAAWAKRIDEIRLERLSPEKVTRWKNDRIASAGHAPAAISSANRTVRSYLRCARSLFSRKTDKQGNPGILALVEKSTKLRLPDVLPFDGVGLPAAGSMKYKSKINAQTLIAAAKKELKAADPEAYKVFLLGLFAGMRKAEIDSAEWGMLNFAKNEIHVEETDVLRLKTEDSAGIISVDPQVVAELRALMPAPTDKPARGLKFILQSSRAPRPDALRPFYRAEDTFDRLNVWLRDKGIRANKPLHELRKEVGAIIAKEQGIFAASIFLRHSDITTTTRHYTDKMTRINVGLGKFLGTAIKRAKTPAKTRTTKAARTKSSQGG